MDEERIGLTSVIGGALCIASDDGQKVYEAIVAALEDGKQVCLSFKGVEDLTSAFLNSAVGQLYGNYEEEFLRERMLPPLDASPEDLALLKAVVERAKDFFRNPEQHRQAAPSHQPLREASAGYRPGRQTRPPTRYPG